MADNVKLWGEMATALLLDLIDGQKGLSDLAKEVERLRHALGDFLKPGLWRIGDKYVLVAEDGNGGYICQIHLLKELKETESARTELGVCGWCGGILVVVEYPTCSVKACSRCDPYLVHPDWALPG